MLVFVYTGLSGEIWAQGSFALEVARLSQWVQQNLQQTGVDDVGKLCGKIETYFNPVGWAHLCEREKGWAFCTYEFRGRQAVYAQEPYLFVSESAYTGDWEKSLVRSVKQLTIHGSAEQASVPEVDEEWVTKYVVVRYQVEKTGQNKRYQAEVYQSGVKMTCCKRKTKKEARDVAMRAYESGIWLSVQYSGPTLVAVKTEESATKGCKYIYVIGAPVDWKPLYFIVKDGQIEQKMMSGRPFVEYPGYWALMSFAKSWDEAIVRFMRDCELLKIARDLNVRVYQPW